jgi:dTDP-4-amino-4,6-dideoxygalactose transaminase
VKLRYLDGSNEERRRRALLYTRRLQGMKIRCPAVRKHVDSVYHLYVIQTQERDSLRDFLRGQGIQTLIHYPVPVHLQNAYKQLGCDPGDLPVTEECSRQILSLPLYPEMPESEIEEVSSQIGNFFKKYPAK